MEEIVTGVYGPDWTEGILSENAWRYGIAPGTTAVEIDGISFPIVCSELVEIHTEDGPGVGRCGTPIDVEADVGACAGHSAEIIRWKNETNNEGAF